MLKPFTEQDAEQLIQWISSERLSCLWGAGSFSFPLTQQQIKQHCQRSDIFPFQFIDDGVAIGYCELFRVSTKHYRICRVLIAEEWRGNGFGKVMLNQLIDKAKTEMACKKVSLSVFEQNDAARNCYRSLGFKCVIMEKGRYQFHGEEWNLIHMERSC